MCSSFWSRLLLSCLRASCRGKDTQLCTTPSTVRAVPWPDEPPPLLQTKGRLPSSREREKVPGRPASPFLLWSVVPFLHKGTWLLDRDLTPSYKTQVHAGQERKREYRKERGGWKQIPTNSCVALSEILTRLNIMGEHGCRANPWGSDQDRVILLQQEISVHPVTQSLLAFEAESKHQLGPGSRWPQCPPYLFNACSIDSFSWFTSFMYDETRNRNSSKLDKSSGRSFRRRAQSSRISCGLEQAYKREGKQKSYYVILWTVIPTPACTQDKLPFCCDDLCYTITAKGETGQWQSMHVEWDLLWGQNKGSNLKEEKKNNLGSKHGTIAFPSIHWQHIWCPHRDLKKWIFSKSAVCYGQTVTAHRV